MAGEYPPGVRPRGENTWQIHYYVPDHGNKFETVRGTLQDAVKERARRVAAIADGRYVLSSRAKLKVLLRQYAEMRTGLEPSYSSTARNIRVAVAAWEKHIGNIQAQKLTAKHVEDAMGVMLTEVTPKGTPRSPKTVKDYHIWLKTVLGWAVKQRILTYNVAKDATTPKVVTPEIRFLSIPQVGVFLKEATRYVEPWVDEDGVEHEGYYAWGVHGRMLAAGVCTGLRTESEWGGMPENRVDLKKGRAMLVQVLLEQRGKGYGKGGVLVPAGNSKHKRREIMLHDIVLPILRVQQQWLAEQREENDTKVRGMDGRPKGKRWNPDGLFFCDADGTPISDQTLRSVLARILAACGLPAVTVHDLRHTFATMMLTLGIHPKVVQEALGHSTIQMTLNTYSHVIPGLQEAAGKVLTAAISSSMASAN